MAKELHYFFPRTAKSIKDAHPKIASLRFDVEIEDYGYIGLNEWQRKERFDLSNIPVRIRCPNPRCQQGGIDVQHYLITHEGLTGGPWRYEFSCVGHEGSPKGRRRGDPCFVHFKVDFDIELKQSTEGAL